MRGISASPTSGASIDTQTGSTALPAVYDVVGPFVDGLARHVEVNGKCGYVNTKGPSAISAVYDDLDPFSEGLAPVKLKPAGMDTSKSQHWLNLVTGWDMCMNEFLLAGERIRKLRRQYDVDYGIGREDDTLPPRILTQERRDGGSTHHLPPFK